MRQSTRLRFGAAFSTSLLLVGTASAQVPIGFGNPTVAFRQPQGYVMEHAGKHRVTVELAFATTRPVSVPFTVGGSATATVDYDLQTASPVVIAAGQVRTPIIIVLHDDADNEQLETIELTLGIPSGPATLGGELTAYTVGVRDFVLGDPIEGLTTAELESFERGRILFEKTFTPSEGLGPFYNATSCQSCHSKPSTGGAAGLYRNFFLSVYYENTPSNQSSSIPPFLSQVVPAFGSGAVHATTTEFTLEGGRPLLSDTVTIGSLTLPTIRAQRNAIPIFGTGLFEFISNVTIQANADPNDTNGDGISGRNNTQLAGAALGRFGTKAQVNNIELFTRAPLNNQMGITTDPLLGLGSIVSLPMSAVQASANPNAPTVDHDPVPDPEMSPGELGDLIAFTKFLAPPLRKIFDDSARRGEQLFEQIGCTGCHIPSLPSSRGPVNAFTDLLIHDLGPELVDNIKLGDSFFAMTDSRTQPLWGISEVGPYLHDGRAETLLQAIEAHGGEATAARTTFLGLTSDEQADVINFLEHL